MFVVETEQWIIVGVLLVVAITGAALLARQSAITGYVVEDHCARCTTEIPACVVDVGGRATTTASRCLAECRGMKILAKVPCEGLASIGLLE